MIVSAAWFEAQEVPVLGILTDRGTEYCGKIENHAFQLYLAIEDVDYSKTKARSPQLNGICERFHKTMKEEFYDIDLRKKIYHIHLNSKIEYNMGCPHK